MTLHPPYPDLPVPRFLEIKMGLLSGSSISRIFGKVFSGVFEDGVLLQIVKDRDPEDGTLRDRVAARIPVKVQFDRVTERMASATGYASTDQSAIILRDGFPLEWIDTDCRLEGRGTSWLLNEVETDPARSYFQARASLSPVAE